MQWKNLLLTIAVLVVVFGFVQVNRIYEDKQKEKMSEMTELFSNYTEVNNELKAKDDKWFYLNWNVKYKDEYTTEAVPKYELSIEMYGADTVTLDLGEYTGYFLDDFETIEGVPENAIMKTGSWYNEQGNNFYCIIDENSVKVYAQSVGDSFKGDFVEITSYEYKTPDEETNYNFEAMPLTYEITNSTEFTNLTNEVFNSVMVYKDNIAKVIIGNVALNETQQGEWGYSEYSNNPSEWKSPLFMLNIAGNRVEVTKARIIGDDVREQIFLSSKYALGTEIDEDMNVNFDNITFFKEDGEYYFTPQVDYFDRLNNLDDDDEIAEYIYLPQVGRWLRQREGQLLFAAGMSQEQFKKYFPDYTGELPEYGMSAIISSEDIYIEDVGVSYNEETATTTEVRYSNEDKLFTTSDVDIVSISMDVMFPQDATYFRYKDSDGNIHRQEVGEQMRDINNGGYKMHVLNLEEMGTRFIPVD